MTLITGFAEHLESVTGSRLVKSAPISGGDINEAYLLTFERSSVFLKYSSRASARHNLQVEAKGLEIIRKTGVIAVPNVIASGSYSNYSYLLLEYIKTSRPTANQWNEFAQSLAKLHQQTADEYGLDFDNYIGALPQSNTRHMSWVEFYISERLEPQWSSAAAFFSDGDKATWRNMLKQLDGLLIDDRPELIHGDLWSGNVIFDAARPYLIDPAICYAHREMDLAMSRLFGGFPASFYETYNSILPPREGWQQRIPLYQLYYLLVHVNLFGSAYAGSVKNILKKYQ